MENTNNCYYSTPENYFLDGNVYKKCYDTCKICTGVGDATDHKCSDCKNTYKKITTEHLVKYIIDKGNLFSIPHSKPSYLH